MTDDQKNKIALFRYGIISELVTGINQYDSKDAYFRAKSEQDWVDMDGNMLFGKLYEAQLCELN